MKTCMWRKDVFSIVFALCLGLLIPATASALVPPESSIAGEFHSWDPSRGVVVVDGRRYVTSQSVEAFDAQGRAIRHDQLRWGMPVVIQVHNDLVYEIRILNAESSPNRE